MTEPKPFEPDTISLGRETVHFLLLDHANLRLRGCPLVLIFLNSITDFSNISQISILFPLRSLWFVSPHFLVEIFGWWRVQERMAGSEEGFVLMQWEDLDFISWPRGQGGHLICPVGVADSRSLGSRPRSVWHGNLENHHAKSPRSWAPPHPCWGEYWLPGKIKKCIWGSFAPSFPQEISYWV